MADVSAFHTGNAGWDQALGTLAGGLFPDPSRIGQAYYYGSEARKAQIEGYKHIGELNAGNATFGMLPGSGVQRSPIEFQQPPISGMGPIMAPPRNLPMQGQPPGAAPGAPAPATSLGQVVSGGPGGQGGQPLPPPPPIQATPDTLGQILAPGSHPNEKGVGATGTPPEASQPAQFAPPAPNTTTSNGQVPTNDQGSGPLHIGTFTAPDGGKKYSAPAQANGSPAPINFDMGTYMALQSAAGRNPEMARAQVIAYAVDAENRGIIPAGSASRLTSFFGAPTYETEQATQRTRITDTGATTRQGMVIAGEKERLAMTPQTTLNAQNEPVFTTTGAVNAAQPGALRSYQPAYDINLLERQKFEQTPLSAQGRDAQGRPTLIMPGGAQTGTPAYSGSGYTTDKAVVTTGTGGPFGSGPVELRNEDLKSGTPGYSERVDTANNAMVEVYRTKPDGTVDASQPPYGARAGDVIRDKLPPTPNNSDQVLAFLKQAALGGDVTQPGRRLADVVAQTAPITPPSSASDEGAKALAFQNQVVERTYQAPDVAPKGSVNVRKEPAQLTAEAATALTDRRDWLMKQYPRMTPENALQTARSDLENEGYLPSTKESADARAGDPTRIWGNPNINLQAKNGQVAGKFMIPLKKDYTSNLTGTVVRAAPGGQGTTLPAGALAVAPKGMADGTPLLKGNQRGIVRNGFIYPVQ